MGGGGGGDHWKHFPSLWSFVKSQFGGCLTHNSRWTTTAGLNRGTMSSQGLSSVQVFFRKGGLPRQGPLQSQKKCAGTIPPVLLRPRLKCSRFTTASGRNVPKEKRSRSRVWFSVSYVGVITTLLDFFWQGVTKRCHLSWLTNSALVYEPKCGGRDGIAGQ